ncbi:hypothetical protein ABAC402_04715 [Asticcacaulis sp. AC402]|nr:hypothetical protein ABAC402_04715 [Asticcacaulis sp. AC402]
MKSSAGVAAGHERAYHAGFPDIRVKPKFKLLKSDRVFTIGSCFARNIEIYLAKAGMDCISLRHTFPGPYYDLGGQDRNGALNAFTPNSMLDVIRLGDRDDRETAGVVQVGDDDYVDMMLWGLRSLNGAELASARATLLRAYGEASQADVHVITLGLTESWFDTKDSIYVNRSPGSSIKTARRGERFEFHNLTPQQTFAKVDEVIQALRGLGKKQSRIIVTVSPVPLASTFTDRDVVSANAYSKSTLLGAAVAVADNYDFVDYMPSYELVTMSRREDAWEEDGAHVKSALVGRVVDFFSRNYFED